MMKKKLFISLALFAVFAMVLSACGGGAPAAPAAEAPAGEEPAAEGGVTIRVWTHQNDAFNDGLKDLADAYMADHPDVSITFETFDYDTYIQTLQTALPAGTEADILQMFGSWVCSYAEGGNLATVPESVLSMAEAKEVIFPAQLAGYDCGGTLYGVPQEFNIEYGATLVNTAIAEEAGVDVSGGWANWDEFIADAKAMTVVQDGVMLRAGYHFTASDAVPATFYSLILQNGGQYLTDEGFKVNTPEGMAALEFMKKLVDEGVVDPVLFNDEENWVGDCYFEENCAMGLVGPWVVADYASDYPDIVEVTKYVPLPYLGSEPKLVAASGWGLSVSANSKVQDAAWDFIKFVALDPANAIQWNLASGTLPALKVNATGDAHDQLVAEFPHFGPFLDILQYAQNEGAFPDRDLIWYDITYPRILEFLQGNASAQDTLETIEREVGESMQ
jgi:multiple sugar transport system substrate-binding protein